MKYYIYGSPWFDVGVFLFVVNIMVNTWRRRPYRFRHAGFLTVHVGVLTIVAGGLCTRWFGIDGSMPIAEGETSRAISLPENDIVVRAGGETLRHAAAYELRPWEERHQDFYEVPGTPYRVFVDRYFPTGAVVDTVLNDAAEPNPMLELALAAPGGEPASRWVAALDSTRATLTVGSARASYVKPEALPALRERWAAEEREEPATLAGRLRLSWTDGRTEVVDVPATPLDPIPTSRPGVHLEIVQVFRSFVLAGDGYADAVDKSENPAIHFRVHRPDGVESHFSFTAFPDFRADPTAGEEWAVSHAAWTPDPRSGPGPGLAEIAIVEESSGRFVTWTDWGDPQDGTPLEIGSTREFEGSGVVLRILDSVENGRVAQDVRRVSDDVARPVLRVHLVELDPEPSRASVLHALRGRRTKTVDCDPNRAWLFHGTRFDFDTPHGPVHVSYEGRTIPLGFGIHLDDFREETYPGVTLAASFESHVRVSPAEGDDFPVRIYMNHPLKYEGYTFFQASFQRNAAGQEVTILSVARDPGMRVSFIGYCILVLGLLLIFFAKPFLVRLDDRHVRRRAASAAPTAEGVGT
jgi:hypothetical protein